MLTCHAQEDLIEAIRTAIEEKLLGSNSKRTFAQVGQPPNEPYQTRLDLSR